TIGFIFAFSSYLLYLNVTEGVASEFFINVGSIGSFDLEFGWVVDGLSIMMYFVVGTVASLVFIYATNYMQGEVRYTFFFTSLTLFAGSMLVLVSSPTLLQLLIGWELVGVCSYLLIGHYWEKKENSSAAMKAFITNKIADVGLMIGIIVLALSTGTMRISEILYQSTHDYESLKSVAYLAGVLLFIGAMGKSAISYSKLTLNIREGSGISLFSWNYYFERSLNWIESIVGITFSIGIIAFPIFLIFLLIKKLRKRE
ncbi:proton-conducting transporter membrane subunit, partial [Acidimicrobiia bacterium]|nr:proton-conducting transporter membrane subunit [Acidimicrobiia bacterium]